MVNLIGFTGSARSGKDTASNHLIENYYYQQYAFAKPIKDACKVIFNWSEAHVNGELKDKIDAHYSVSPRQAMQTLGTEWGRNTINNELWLLRAQDEINNTDKLVISDVRFDNEAELILSNGGIVIKVIRDNINQVNSHISEAGVSDHLINYIVYNNGSKAELWDRIYKIVLEHF